MAVPITYKDCPLTTFCRFPTLVKNERFLIDVQMAVPQYNNSVFLKYLGKGAQ